MSLRILYFIFITCTICSFTFSQQEEGKKPSYQELAKIVVKLEERLENYGVQLDEIKNRPQGGHPSYQELAKLVIKLQELLKLFGVRVDKLEQISSAENQQQPDVPKKSSVCDKKPCLNGELCVASSTGSTYKCTNCPYPTTGKNCDQINCGVDKCFAGDGMKYTVLSTRSNWPRAKVLCIRNGMSLAMPKNRETDEALRSQLKAMYGSNSHTRLWFGLKRIGRFWHWVDGSLLGEYTGGQDWFPNRKPCASMYASGQGWHPDFCGQNSGYYYYPLCEKRLFS